MREIRIEFEKTGDAKYISHLDFNRVLFRAVRRAGIPIWYTEGFNPHPYFKYPLSLPLGIESKCECVDLKLRDDGFTDEKVKLSFNGNLPSGLKVMAVHEPIMKANEIYCAIYNIEYETEFCKEFAARVKSVMDSGELIAKKMVKHGKRKELEDFNILESVITYSLTVSASTVKLRLLCLAGQNKNLNPMLLSEALEKEIQSDYISRSLLKEGMYNSRFEKFS